MTDLTEEEKAQEEDLKARRIIVDHIRSRHGMSSAEFRYPHLHGVKAYWVKEAARFTRDAPLHLLSSLLDDKVARCHRYLVKGVCEAKIKI